MLRKMDELKVEKVIWFVFSRYSLLENTSINPLAKVLEIPSEVHAVVNLYTVAPSYTMNIGS